MSDFIRNRRSGHALLGAAVSGLRSDLRWQAAQLLRDHPLTDEQARVVARALIERRQNELFQQEAIFAPPAMRPRKQLQAADLEAAFMDLEVFGIPDIEYLWAPYVVHGVRHWIFGSAESSKSMWAAWIAANVSQHFPVVYVGYENPFDEEVRRLNLLGADPTRFHLLHESEVDLAQEPDVRDFLEFVRETRAKLVVLDAFTSVWIGNENANEEIARFDRAVLMPLRDMGVASIVIDHTGHPTDVQRTGVHAGRGGSSKAQKTDIAYNFKSAGGTRFTVTHAKGARTHRGKKEPPRTFEVVDTARGGLTIREVETLAQFSEKAEEAVGVIRAEDGIGTKKLQGALKLSGDSWRAVKALLQGDERIRAETRGQAVLWFGATNVPETGDSPI